MSLLNIDTWRQLDDIKWSPCLYSISLGSLSLVESMLGTLIGRYIFAPWDIDILVIFDTKKMKLLFFGYLFGTIVCSQYRLELFSNHHGLHDWHAADSSRSDFTRAATLLQMCTLQTCRKCDKYNLLNITVSRSCSIVLRLPHCCTRLILNNGFWHWF